MLTSKENYLRAITYDNPEWVPDYFDDACSYKPPVWNTDPETGRDFCNIKWVRDDFGSMPDYNYMAMEDICDWREIVKFPDLEAIDWQAEADNFFNSDAYDPDKMLRCQINTHGMFLTVVNMMGWENGLCAIYEEPEEFHAFVDAITDMLVGLVHKCGQYFKPTIMVTGDDFSGNDGPFISKETFYEFYKANLQRVCDAIHEEGAFAEFHNCGRNGYLIDEVLEMGYDIMQLPVQDEDLLAAKKKYGQRLVVTDGFERHGAAGMPGAPEEVVRKSVHDSIDIYGKDGGLVYWDGGIITVDDDGKQKKAWANDEFYTYGRAVYKK